MFGRPLARLQIPSYVGPGGFSNAPNANTSPGAIALALQPQHARGGQVDGDALGRAHALLFHCQRAVGGAVIARAEGGKIGGVPLRLPHTPSATELLAQLDRIERQSPSTADADRKFSYWCQKSPRIALMLRHLLEAGYSRSGARVTIHGDLKRIAGQVDE
jgi:hypothetical protein